MFRKNVSVNFFTRGNCYERFVRLYVVYMKMLYISCFANKHMNLVIGCNNKTIKRRLIRLYSLAVEVVSVCSFCFHTCSYSLLCYNSCPFPNYRCYVRWVYIWCLYELTNNCFEYCLTVHTKNAKIDSTTLSFKKFKFLHIPLRICCKWGWMLYRLSPYVR